MLVLLIGQPGSGKSTIADKLGWPTIDGDRLRSRCGNPGYGHEGRMVNASRAALIASYLRHDSKVLVAMVLPYQAQRDMFDADLTIHLTGTPGVRPPEHLVSDFETPTNCLTIDTDELTIEETTRIVHRALATAAPRTRMADTPET